jgi:tetratricopeptide (TPR) repeat protein
MWVRSFWFLHCFVFAPILLSTVAPAPAVQLPSTKDIQYSEDYEKLQEIGKIPQLSKRAEALLSFMRERPHSQLTEYADRSFFEALDLLIKQSNNAAAQGFAQRMMKLRPRSGEAYLFYGITLKNQQRYDEAMDVLAKSYLMKGNKLAPKAKELLDAMYRARHSGSLTGEDALLKKAQQELK